MPGLTMELGCSFLVWVLAVCRSMSTMSSDVLFCLQGALAELEPGEGRAHSPTSG